MTDTTLKERLDALRSQAMLGEPIERKIAQFALKELLFSQYEAGNIDLTGDRTFTRTELDAAVARAVETERAACAWIAQNACLVPPDGGSPTEEEADLCDRAAARIRARGEDQA